MRLKALLIAACVAAISAGNVEAQKVKDLEGEYVYQQPDDESRTVAKAKAVQQAKINALAREFGTTVASRSTTTLNDSKVSHFMVGINEVKGEWIKDNRPPEITPMIDPSTHKQYLKVKVWFQAREIISQAVEVESHLLRNGTDLKFEDDEFNSGDQMFLYFKSPVDGHLVIYNLGEDEVVYRLLPYSASHSGSYRIEANKDYVFFSKKHLNDNETTRGIDEIELTAVSDIEWNSICVVFSPNAFAHPQDFSSERKDGSMLGLAEQSVELPRSLRNDKFQDWLAKVRIKDPKMSYTPIDIKIHRKEHNSDSM